MTKLDRLYLDLLQGKISQAQYERELAHYNALHPNERERYDLA